MIVINTESVPGKEVVKILGLVQGNTIRAKHAGRDIMAGLKNIVGGELTAYTELLTEARREAMQRMLCAYNSRCPLTSDMEARLPVALRVALVRGLSLWTTLRYVRANVSSASRLDRWIDAYLPLLDAPPLLRV